MELNIVNAMSCDLILSLKETAKSCGVEQN